MKSNWWIAASVVVVLGLLFQPGCAKPDALPTTASPDETIDDFMTGDEEVDDSDSETVDPGVESDQGS